MKKIIPGYRIFTCLYCDETWRERCRDCHTLSVSFCQKCDEFDGCDPVGFEEHAEWPIDNFGNLIEVENE